MTLTAASVSAQPVPLRNPSGIIVRKPCVARRILPNQRLQRQVDSDCLN
jgi:hypothetical protein